MTPNEQEWFDQLDQYIKGNLSIAEREIVEEKMRSDKNFKARADEHMKLIQVLAQYGKRESMKASFNEIHDSIEVDIAPSQVSKPISTSSGRRMWPMIAVAAAVTLISVVGTLVATHSLEQKQTANYRELRKNVEQIKRSQKAMMADIQEVKEKDDPFPGNYEGTGFLISADGYVATSYHVIRDADSVYIVNDKFGRLKTSIVKVDKMNDVALLKIADDTFNTAVPFTINASESDIGEDVFTLGFPREDIVYGEGTISASTGFHHNTHAYQIAVPLNPGNSGGPLFNKQGQLIGIISGIQTETVGAAFAVKSSALLDVINIPGEDSVTLNVALAKQNKLKPLSRVEQIKRLKEFVFVVKVFNSK